MGLGVLVEKKCKYVDPQVRSMRLVRCDRGGDVRGHEVAQETGNKRTRKGCDVRVGLLVVVQWLMAHRSFRAIMSVVKGRLGSHTPASSATIGVVSPLPALRRATALGVFLPPAGSERDRHDVPPYDALTPSTSRGTRAQRSPGALNEGTE